jgi:hypothetical protein
MSDWKTVTLKKVDSGFGGMIPCKDVQQGNILYFIQGFNAQNDPVATSGSKGKPFTVEVKDEVEGPPPSLPGEEPPKQCTGAAASAETECPPDFPGCAGAGKDAGEECDKDKECKSHSCLDGKCAEGSLAEGEECEKDAQCKSGMCTDDKKCGAAKKGEGEECGADDECDSGKCREDKCQGAGRGGKFPRVWIGGALQLDLLLLPGGQDVCVLNFKTGIGGLSDNPGYSCIDPSNGANFPGGGQKDGGKALNLMIAQSAGPPPSDEVKTGGFKPANLRLLVSIDYALNQNMLLGARAGYVLFTDPGASPGAAFPPLHLEARFTLLVGHNALTKKGIAPMLFAGVGAGEFDAFVPVTVLSNPKVTGKAQTELPENAWLTAGPIFASAGGGARFLLSSKVAATAALKFEAGFGGAAGFLPGIAPELGLQFGF